jgi:selenocysteine-specific elongation factor
MTAKLINITIGTAGHIDHGKTALVKCLTGCDTDRLKAEKERGMSIDLGFAPCKLADMEVGIVDVPGHENFIKTMVAGAAGMDAVVLVVAADDGVMPQTREHLDILTLLGVEHGMVALTKIDRVAPDRVEAARAQTAELLRGTFLDGAPIRPVSSVTLEGFDPFYESLVAVAGQVQPKRIDGVFRLPLDRAFSVKGHGTVVSGIPVAGSARLGDEVILLPHGDIGRIRRVEVYGHTSETVLAGQCAALNVGHWDHRKIGRGHTLTVPDYFSPHQWHVCRLRLLPGKQRTLKIGAQVKFHTGTSDVPATVFPLKGDRMQPGEEHLVQIRAQTPLVAGPGDRFILRSASPVETIGGGMVIEALTHKLKRKHPHLHESIQQRAEAATDERRFVEYCLRTAPLLAARPADVALRAKVPGHRVEEMFDELARQKKIYLLSPGKYIHRETAAEAERRILEAVRQFHEQAPESPGITRDELRESTRIDKAALDGLVARITTEGRLVENNRRLANPEHRAMFQPEDAESAELIESLFRRQAFQPPGADDLVKNTGATAQNISKIIKILVQHDRLVQVAEGLLFHREAVDRGREILIEYFQKEERLESVKFKYLLDTTRKYALPLLDYFDRVGVTRRAGNTRYLQTPPAGKPPS